MNKVFRNRVKLRSRLDDLRAEGKKVILTNGAFDIIHVGHIRSFVDAKNHADVLVVAVNTDESIRRYKGPTRPFVPLSERLETLAAFQCVDYVIPFDEDTADAIILALEPEFHAKGTDRTPDSVPERESVLSYGGQVVITGDPKDHSTTELIDKIMKAHGTEEDKK